MNMIVLIIIYKIKCSKRMLQKSPNTIPISLINVRIGSLDLSESWKYSFQEGCSLTILSSALAKLQIRTGGPKKHLNLKPFNNYA